MRRTPLIAALLAAAVLAAACSNGALLDAAGPKKPGHVYLMRGLAGEVFSLGLHSLAGKLNERGIAATVHSLPAAITLPDDIAERYRSDPSSAPIVLLGHSSGGDAIISIAERLKARNVPVALAFGFDPTPLAGRVPDNVELFINIFQKTNPIGGAEARPATGFKGRLINVDLREHKEIVHITLDKTTSVHDAVVDEIVGVVSATQARNAGSPPPRITARRNAPAPVRVRPLILRYVIPQDAPVELWDSALRITVKPDDSLEAIVSEFGTPGWLIAQVNRLQDDALPTPGGTILIPQHAYRPSPQAAAR